MSYIKHGVCNKCYSLLHYTSIRDVREADCLSCPTGTSILFETELERDIHMVELMHNVTLSIIKQDLSISYCDDIRVLYKPEVRKVFPTMDTNSRSGISCIVNSLLNNNITTFRQLCDISYKELLSKMNVGKKMVWNIIRILDYYKLDHKLG